MIPVHPLADMFPLVEGEEFAALVEDVREHGLREPIRLWRGAILDGRNRYRALVAAERISRDCRAAHLIADRLAIDCSSVPVEGLPRLVVSLNLRRRHLSASQRALVAAEFARLTHGGVRVRAEQEANLPLDQARIADAAGALQVSPRMVREARGLMAEAPAEVIADVRAGHLAVHDARDTVRQARAALGHRGEALDPDAVAEAYRVIRAEREADEARKKAARLAARLAARAERQEALAGKIVEANAALAIEERRYGVIYADPEWQWEAYSEAGMSRAAENHYPTSRTEDIAARPVGRLAARHCVLLLWATAPRLPDALAVLSAWGFTYKSHLVWVKRAPDGALQQGTGYWARNAHELLLIGTRGAPPCPAMGMQGPSVVEAERGAHSAKPVCFAEWIEAHWPDVPKIELNARVARAGWVAWGAEAPRGAE